MNLSKILITGADGFIGKNLCNSKLIYEKFDILRFIRSSSLNELERYIKESSIIIHLAGENRAKTSDKFYDNNFKLTKNICDILIKNKLNTPIIFSSTIHVTSDNIYGKTKKLAENELEKLANINGNQITILRLPGVFGKWSKPNYNSVVSTFCYNIANNLTSHISKLDIEIKLIYIDDLVKILSKYIKSKTKDIKFINLDKYTYKISLGDLYDRISKFNTSRIDLTPVNIVKGFNKKLYSTFISYLPKEKIVYPLIENLDKRGKFFEIFKEKNGSQISIFTAYEDVTRGGHFHNTKVEKFLVLSGKAKFVFKDLNTNDKIEFVLDENDYKVIESIPGSWHIVENLGKKELKVLVWANEVFNKNNDDTYR